ncbi:MAG: glutamate-cysteine ligase family protein [Defluviitaleaceae bacterium]|nr:glutamate-cysteine ligase family protein [Defluviitaleaceae bacterium]
MNFKERNLFAMVEYFAAGCKKDQLLGLELEHFVVDKHSRRSLPYEGGVEEILKHLQPVYGEPILSPEPQRNLVTKEVKERIIGIMREDSMITLEPAAQLEVIIGPVRGLREIAQIYATFTGLLTPILDGMGCELVCAGYQPKSKVDELSLIPKQRYEYMYSHFKNTGKHGKNMMKGTAATQVTIDYKDEEDFNKKFRVANILCPLFAFLCDNTEIFEGEPITGRMIRTHIWNDVDPARCMVVKGALEKSFGFREYSEFLYNKPPILMMKNGEAVYTGTEPASSLFKDREMTEEDILHISTMAFPDVCLKKYIEIRMADSMPISHAIAYMALIKGLMYDNTNLDALHEATLSVRNRDIEEAKAALMQNGAEALVYGRRGGDWVAEMLECAESGLSAEDKAYLQPMHEWAVQKGCI